jgi:hypothetical protein
VFAALPGASEANPLIAAAQAHLGDALVWAMSDLLVEPMPNEGHFEYMRQRAAALKEPPPEPPKPVYAPGSLEYERQQAEKGE